MEKNFPAESTIRDYLLGRLDDQPGTEGKLSEQILLDDDLAETVDAIADEIIEDYLDGALDADDKKAVEEYFLRPPERRKKLEFERFLRRKIAGGQETGNVPSAMPVLKQKSTWVLGRASHFRTYAELVALVLLIIAVCAYVGRVRHGFQEKIKTGLDTQAQLERQLDQERGHSATLAKRLSRFEPPVANLAFFSVLRDRSTIPDLEVYPYTERIKIEIQLPKAATKAYDVKLNNSAGDPAWSHLGVNASDGELSFEMPVQAITGPGKYCLAISSLQQPFCFQARIVKEADK